MNKKYFTTVIIVVAGLFWFYASACFAILNSPITSINVPTLGYYWYVSPVYYGWDKGLDPTTISVTYIGGDQNGGTAVCGQDVTLKIAQDTISWNGTGYSNDSPYGVWSVSAPSFACNNGDRTTSSPTYDCLGYRADPYIPLVMTPSQETITNR